MNNTIRTLAEGFFSLTGRPISTMTMDEYISLRRYAESLPSSVAPFIKPEQAQKESQTVKRTTQNEEMSANEVQAEIVSTASNHATPKIVPVPAQAPQKTQCDALAMLKAVSG